MIEDKVLPFRKPRTFTLPSCLKIDETIRKAVEVLKSGTIHAAALQSTIDSQHKAIVTLRALNELDRG